MASKYDQFWRERLAELHKALKQAAIGETAGLDVAAIKQLGRRTSWYGSTRVRDGEFLAGNMAHAVSLGWQVLQSGMLAAWPETVFTLSISDGGRLTVEARSPAALTAELMPQAVRQDAEHARAQDRDAGIVHSSEACRRIHRALEALPLYRRPAEVPFDNGLYFFYEHGEKSDHGTTGRVVRIGNHPGSQNRLIGRLTEHYGAASNAKNGSVFRRYLGGALMRRSTPDTRCLMPAPGRGHWERQNEHECARCRPVEEDVSTYLAERMTFRCVQVDDLELRNHLEKVLIAAVAQCETCVPSDEWLGECAYPREVRSTGLWNVQHTGGPPMSAEDLRRFEAISDAAAPSKRSTQGREDLSDTLLVIPCSGSKKGASVPDLPVRRAADYLDPASVRLLEEGRDLAFARRGVHLDRSSPLIPAIAMYSGQPYATPGLRSLLLEAIEQGLHCLIVSGGYGIVRPEEPVHRYKAHMPSQTRGVWTRRLTSLLPSYMEQNGIERAFVAVSRSYAGCLPHGFAQEEWWGVPNFDPRHDQGAALQVVPAKVGQTVVDLIRNGMQPGADWSADDLE